MKERYKPSCCSSVSVFLRPPRVIWQWKLTKWKLYLYPFSLCIVWAEGADRFDFISCVLYPFVPRALPGSESVCQEDLCPTRWVLCLRNVRHLWFKCFFCYNDVPKITIDQFTRPLLNNRARQKYKEDSYKPKSFDIFRKIQKLQF